jgi:hypothetical protein
MFVCYRLVCTLGYRLVCTSKRWFALGLLLLGMPVVAQLAPVPHRFQGTALPEPPQQKKPWTPPRTSVPDKVVAAFATLFDQGLADPRGCDYHEVSVARRSRWDDAGVEKKRGWVLPAGEGEKQRFAICVDGLVYPLVAIGPKADFVAEIQKDLEAIRSGKESPWSLELFQVGYLLRLGEGELAFRVWQVLNPAPTDDAPPREKLDIYARLTHLLAWHWFHRGLYAHERGDDSLALGDFRRVSAFAEAARAEFKKRNLPPDDTLGCLRQLPALLADQERRAREKRPAIVCLGPGRHPDAATRIAALIDRLDELDASRVMVWSLGFPSSCDRDRIVEALVAEGEPALEPILKRLEKEERFTRFLDSRHKYQGPECVTVREAEQTAVSGILSRAGVPEPPTGDIAFEKEADRKQYAERIRAALKKSPAKPPAERWYATLADDNSTLEEKLAAARGLVTPVPIAGRTPFLWASYTVHPDWRVRPEGRPPGKDLRDVNLTALLVRRMKETQDAEKRLTFLDLLQEWDAAAAKEHLAEAMQLCRDNKLDERYMRLVLHRVEDGDRKALDDYLTFLPQATPGVFSYWANLFAPALRYPDHPGMRQAIDKLFLDRDSRWVPLRTGPWSTGGRVEVEDVLIPKLLAFAGVRKALLRELARTEELGPVDLDGDGGQRIEGPNFSWGRHHHRPDPDIPLEGMRVTVRVRDWVGWMLSERVRGPRCELHWPVARRDRAITEWIALLGDEKHWAGDVEAAGRAGKPATPEQVKRGDAIFSLAGSGEVRVVPGLKLPLPGRWTALKDRPVRKTRLDQNGKVTTTSIEYEQSGQIVQAEEVFEDGRWKRYYGFAGAYRTAQVPADEIEFQSDFRDSALAPKFHLLLRPPAVPADAVEGFAPNFDETANLTFTLVGHNTSGLDLPLPEPNVRLRLFHSEAGISRQGARTPKAERDEDWREIVGAQKQLWTPAEKPLTPLEERTVATIELRRWFDLKEPGFYRVRLEIAGKEASEYLFSLAPRGRP